MDSPPVTDDQEPRRYGRRLFLATVAGGVSSLYWGKAAWDHVTGIVSPVADAIAPILPTGGWRIYTISGHMPTFDPATFLLVLAATVLASVASSLVLVGRALREPPQESISERKVRETPHTLEVVLRG